MKNNLLFFLITGISILQASSSQELPSFVAGNTISSQFVSRAKQDLGACWFPPVPCWGEPCQSTYPDSCLTKYNRKQEKNFRKLFPEGGPWDMPGNPIEKCLVNYMHNTTPYNCTIATAIPATVLAATNVGAGIGSVSICIGQTCCGCPDGHNTCAHFGAEICWPFACDSTTALCCPPNVNILTMLAELGCMALPFGCGGLECCCIDFLAKSKNWITAEHQASENIDL